jgi:hypothetical protein
MQLVDAPAREAAADDDDATARITAIIVVVVVKPFCYRLFTFAMR